MRRNLSTLLAVFAVIFALAFLLNRGKVRSARPEPPDTALPAATPLPAIPAAAPAPTAIDTPPPAEFAGQFQPPPGDSLPRNPREDATFPSPGRYQLYRQGDLTWRLDTRTGRTCILFATDDQWSNPRIYQHGCGESN